jgi:S1-C subfamily serine protease
MMYSRGRKGSGAPSGAGFSPGSDAGVIRRWPALRLAGLAALTATLLLVAGCTTRYVRTEAGRQAYYQTSFPHRDTSTDLDRIFRSVKRLQVTAYYTTYRFPPDSRITDADLRTRATYARAAEQFSFDHSKSGTATILSRSGAGVTLITNDHVTRMPDTVVVHFGDVRDPRRDRTRYVESVTIKTSQRNLVLGMPDPFAFRVMARDSANDIALIGVDLPVNYDRPIYPLNVQQGDAARLVWGSFVYVLGYPRGYAMVTRGIVSDPNRSSDNGFLIDGMFNRGISGGLILAVRGDTGALEWIGMAAAASAQAEFLLHPERRGSEEEGMLLPYDGRLFIERAPRIDYGITFPVSMTAIRRFMRSAGLLLAAPARLER